MAYSHKYPPLLALDISNDPATRDELDVFDMILYNGLARTALESAYSIDALSEKADSQQVIRFLISNTRNFPRGVIPAILRVVAQFTRRRLFICDAVKLSLFRLMMEFQAEEAPKLATQLELGCWDIVGEFYNLGWRFGIESRLERGDVWNSLVSRTLSKCLVSKSCDEPRLCYHLLQAICVIDNQWEWPDKMDFIEVVFECVADPDRLLVLASRCLRFSNGMPFRFKPNETISKLANEIATWALYGIRQSWLVGHEWIPLNFSYLYEQPFGCEVVDVDALGHEPNTRAVRAFSDSIADRVLETVKVKPLSRLIAGFCVGCP